MNNKIAKQFKFDNENGTIDVWNYDAKGDLIAVIVDVPLNWKDAKKAKVVKTTPPEEQYGDQSKLNKTERKYFNPVNSKWVGYQRARRLGLV